MARKAHDDASPGQARCGWHDDSPHPTGPRFEDHREREPRVIRVDWLQDGEAQPDGDDVVYLPRGGGDL